MREIKFRAWDNKEKKWLMGYEQLGGFSLVGEMVLLGEWAHEIDKFLFSRNGYTLDDLKIMQFTGLHDKNGKEIYEGGIIKCYDKSDGEVYNHEVKLPDFYREIWSSKIVGEEKMWLPADKGETCGGVETIGNVYENPELLTN